MRERERFMKRKIEGENDVFSNAKIKTNIFGYSINPDFVRIPHYITLWMSTIEWRANLH